jgi:hypothetical protein
MNASAPIVRLDRALFMRLADCLVVAIAIALPWSISATAICVLVWLLVLLPALNIASLRRELATLAGGIPVLLWCFGAVGMVWADVTWTERFQGLGSFHRLLVIPLLLAQFRRAWHGSWVIYGFLISSAFVLIASYVLILNPAWTPRRGLVGVAAHDHIFQGSICLICGFSALGYATLEAGKRHWLVILGLITVAILFLTNFLFVPAFSRTPLAVAPVLTVLLGWRVARSRGILGACALAAAVTLAFSLTSPNLHARVQNSIVEFRQYWVANRATSIGMHVAFLKESLTIISSAPLIGHGTGSIAKEFAKVTTGGQGAAGVATVNPHNQTVAVAIQIGLLGAIVLWSMWVVHLRLFRGNGTIAWLGIVIVVENIISSVFHSHLFDSSHGWLYVFGIGVLGGMVQRNQSFTTLALAGSNNHRKFPP